MIYVLVGESGSYEDKSVYNVFASISKNIVEKKKNELEEQRLIYIKASTELNDYNKDLWSKFDGSKEQRGINFNLLDLKAKELQNKYHLKYKPSVYIEHIYYWIDEVESD